MSITGRDIGGMNDVAFRGWHQEDRRSSIRHISNATIGLNLPVRGYTWSAMM